ncbi:unnamed protein product, partial [Trypanosoma congolense IL3000]
MDDELLFSIHSVTSEAKQDAKWEYLPDKEIQWCDDVSIEYNFIEKNSDKCCTDVQASKAAKVKKRAPGKGSERSTRYLELYYSALSQEERPKPWAPDETFHPVIDHRSEHIASKSGLRKIHEVRGAVRQIVQELWCAHAPVGGHVMTIDGVYRALRHVGVDPKSALGEKFLSMLTLGKEAGRRVVDYMSFTRMFTKILQSPLLTPRGAGKPRKESVPCGNYSSLCEWDAMDSVHGGIAYSPQFTARGAKDRGTAGTNQMFFSPSTTPLSEYSFSIPQSFRNKRLTSVSDVPSVGTKTMNDSRTERSLSSTRRYSGGVSDCATARRLSNSRCGGETARRTNSRKQSLSQQLSRGRSRSRTSLGSRASLFKSCIDYPETYVASSNGEQVSGSSRHRPSHVSRRPRRQSKSSAGSQLLSATLMRGDSGCSLNTSFASNSSQTYKGRREFRGVGILRGGVSRRESSSSGALCAHDITGESSWGRDAGTVVSSVAVLRRSRCQDKHPVLRIDVKLPQDRTGAIFV